MRLENMEYWYPSRVDKDTKLKDCLIDLVASYRDWILRRGYFAPRKRQVYSYSRDKALKELRLVDVITIPRL